MSEPQLLELDLTIYSSDSTDEELDRMTRQLLSELKNFDIESVYLATGDALPEGAKAVDSVTMGAIAMAVLPSILPQVLEFLQSWTLQSKGRTIKFKGKIANRQIDFEGSFEEMEKLVAMLEKEQRK